MVVSILKNDICFRKYDGFTIIYDLRSKSIARLDSVAEDIFLYISEKESVSVKQISSYIADLYEYDEEEVQKDTIQFLHELYNLGLIQIDGHYCTQKNKEYGLSLENEDYEGEIIQILQEQDQLYSTTLEMTYLCNERCVHCYACLSEEYKLTSEYLTLEQYKHIIDELYELNCMHLAFTGGDPFVYKDFFEVFEYARSKQFVCDIYTNALNVIRQITWREFRHILWERRCSPIV